MGKLFTTLACLFCLLPINLVAKPTLNGINLGQYVSGKKVSPESLKGKIVLFEYWGVNCPPCLASIPHLKKWQDKYSRDYFVIIASQYQTMDVKSAKSVWHKRGGGDEISVVNFADIQGVSVSRLPRCFLFDHTGKLIHDGSPFDVEEKIEKAFKATPAELVSGMTYQFCKTEASALTKRKGTFASIIKKLEKKKTSENEQTVKEAEHLLSKIDEWVKKNQTKVDELYGTDPLEFKEEVESIIKTIGKHDHADWFTDKAKLLKSKEYRNELTAIKYFEKWRLKGEKVGLLGHKIDSKAKKYLKTFIKGGQSLIKKYPGTIAEKKISDTLDSFR